MGKILSFFQTGDNVDKETLSNERKKQFELRVQHRYEQENLSTTNKQLTKDQKNSTCLTRIRGKYLFDWWCWHW